MRAPRAAVGGCRFRAAWGVGAVHRRHFRSIGTTESMLSDLVPRTVALHKSTKSQFYVLHTSALHDERRENEKICPPPLSPPALKTSGQLNNSWPTLTCGHPIFHCGPLWDRGVVIPPPARNSNGGRNRARARSARRRRRAGARRVGSRSSPNAQNTRPRCPSRTSEHQFRFFGVKLKILHPCTSTALSRPSWRNLCASTDVCLGTADTAVLSGQVF